MNNKDKIISDLMIQLGISIGFLKGLFWHDEIKDTEESIGNIIDILEDNADRILKELNNAGDDK